MLRSLPLITVLAAALTTACASSGAVPRPFPAPGTSTGTAPAAPSAPSADGYALAGTALRFRGVPYRDGGADPNGFDCSGLIQFVFAQHGVFVPRTVAEQFRQGTSIAPEQIAAGDLLFFSTKGPGASHVAMAIGGDEFVHAPTTNGVVRVERLSASYWSARFVGAKRLF